MINKLKAVKNKLFKPMKYFKLEEFTTSRTAIKYNINNKPDGTVLLNIQELVEKVLDPAREEYNAPIIVTSGYRCPELNKKVGGVANSQHVTGEAADITTGSVANNKKLFKILEERGMYDQLIDEYNYSWIHVSWKRTGNNRKQILHITKK